jgi:rubrerythrin
MTERIQIEVGQELIFVAARTGRRIPVVVTALHSYMDYATVAQSTDPTKTREVSVGELETTDGKRLVTARTLAERAKMAPLQDAMNAVDRYECLECGAKHQQRACPVCGSADRIENVR